MQTNLSFQNQNTLNDEDGLLQKQRKTQQLAINELGKALLGFGVWTIISILGCLITYSGINLYWIYYSFNQYINIAAVTIGLWICAYNVTRKILACYLCISHPQLLRAYHLTVILLFIQTLMVIALVILSLTQYYIYPMYYTNTNGYAMETADYNQYNNSVMMISPWYYFSYYYVGISLICISGVTFFILGTGIIKAFRTFIKDYFSPYSEYNPSILRITQGIANLQKGFLVTVILFLFPLFGLLWFMRGYYQMADGLLKFSVEPSQNASVQQQHTTLSAPSNFHALPQTPKLDERVRFCPYCGNRSEATLARYCAQCGASFEEQ